MSLAEIKKNLKDRIRSAIPADSIVGPEMIGFNRGMKYAIEQIELEEKKIKERIKILEGLSKTYNNSAQFHLEYSVNEILNELRGMIGK